MSIVNGRNPEVAGIRFVPQVVIPDDSQETANTIKSESKVVTLGANVNGVTDFAVLPSLASVQDGHRITIIAGAANCELRTPASSAEEINSEDCDGTKELLITATTIVYVTKIDNTIGWMSNAMTAIGAVATAVVPD